MASQCQTHQCQTQNLPCTGSTEAELGGCTCSFLGGRPTGRFSLKAYLLSVSLSGCKTTLLGAESVSLVAENRILKPSREISSLSNQRGIVARI